ncbi:DUF4390 domain-containing protein [Ramlibacter sp.]|uniref:DUF4390 domain-containing protein n=1 Tax=Ramlibacter sp. TaxID=1917967 RepID=UPI002B521383|nr:DUF4390 domain-containing protein [Ramlibacter sp.]HWI81579.1 DUF4390 domain-containing protein [Ramlibacter sp.]
MGPIRVLARGLERALAAVLALCLLALAAPAQAQSGNAEITQLRLERSEEGLLLSANVRFDLPPVIEDALAKGIPMFFVAEAVLFRDRWYWYDKQVVTAARHMRLSFQPLTRRWRLVVSSSPIGNSGLALGQTFDTRDEALAAVQRIYRWKVAEPGDIDAEGRHNVDFRFRLDVSQLPRPFQIGAVGQADWSISAMRNQRLALENAR